MGRMTDEELNDAARLAAMGEAGVRELLARHASHATRAVAAESPLRASIAKTLDADGEIVLHDDGTFFEARCGDGTVKRFRREVRR
jgi:hypothetical protein